jgi:hypothetical protein
MIIINILKGGNRLDFTTEKDERLFHLLELTKRPIGTRQSIFHVWASYLPNIRDNFIESRGDMCKAFDIDESSPKHPRITRISSFLSSLA